MPHPTTTEDETGERFFFLVVFFSVWEMCFLFDININIVFLIKKNVYTFFFI